VYACSDHLQRRPCRIGGAAMSLAAAAVYDTHLTAGKVFLAPPSLLIFYAMVDVLGQVPFQLSSTPYALLQL
jgi:hypothetical protein